MSTSLNVILGGVLIVMKKGEKAVVIHAIILVKPRKSVPVCEIRRNTCRTYLILPTISL